MAGGEREAVGGVWIAAIVVGMLGNSLYILVGSLVTAYVLHQLLKALAKRDPQAIAVYRRSFARKPFYPARPDTASPIDYAGGHKPPLAKQLLGAFAKQPATKK